GWRGDQSLALDRRRQDDDAGPIVDVAAPAGGLLPQRGLLERLVGEAIVLADLPVRESGEQRGADRREDDQEEQCATARVRSTHDRWADGLVAVYDDRRLLLGEIGVYRHLPDCRLLGL